MALSKWNSCKTILVAENNSIVLSVVCRILKSAGFSVLVAAGGAEAMEVASSHKGLIDLLIANVHMPVITGPMLGETLKRLRPDIRVILMSGLRDEDSLALSNGWASLDKPFLSAKLLEMVDDVFAASSDHKVARAWSENFDLTEHSTNKYLTKQRPRMCVFPGPPPGLIRSQASGELGFRQH